MVSGMLWTTVIAITPAGRRMNGKMPAAARATHQTIHRGNFRTAAFLAPAIKQDRDKYEENKPLQHKYRYPRGADRQRYVARASDIKTDATTAKSL